MMLTLAADQELTQFLIGNGLNAATLQMLQNTLITSAGSPKRFSTWIRRRWLSPSIEGTRRWDLKQ
jgi:hypothetical protein